MGDAVLLLKQLVHDGNKFRDVKSIDTKNAARLIKQLDMAELRTLTPALVKILEANKDTLLSLLASAPGLPAEYKQHAAQYAPMLSSLLPTVLPTLLQQLENTSEDAIESFLTNLQTQGLSGLPGLQGMIQK